MQRNSTYKKTIITIVWLILYIFYSSLTTIYLFLPPLMGVLFILFTQVLQKHQSIQLYAVLASIFILEVQKGFLSFSVLIYFFLLYRYIMPKLQQLINDLSFKAFVYVVIVYFGYILFSSILAQIFMLPFITVSYYIIFYIIIEFFIVKVIL